MTTAELLRFLAAPPPPTAWQEQARDWQAERRATMATATAVFVVDSSDLDATGDEFATWDVYVGDDDGEPEDPTHRTTESFTGWYAALRYADRVAARRGGLEVVTA